MAFVISHVIPEDQELFVPDHTARGEGGGAKLEKDEDSLHAESRLATEAAMRIARGVAEVDSAFMALMRPVMSESDFETLEKRIFGILRQRHVDLLHVIHAGEHAQVHCKGPTTKLTLLDMVDLATRGIIEQRMRQEGESMESASL